MPLIYVFPSNFSFILLQSCLFSDNIITLDKDQVYMFRNYDNSSRNHSIEFFTTFHYQNMRLLVPIGL